MLSTKSRGPLLKTKFLYFLSTMFRDNRLIFTQSQYLFVFCRKRTGFWRKSSRKPLSENNKSYLSLTCFAVLQLCSFFKVRALCTRTCTYFESVTHFNTCDIFVNLSISIHNGVQCAYYKRN